MNRDEFEEEYAKRHMDYDPRSMKSKIDSVERLRHWDGYTDTHIDLCWKVQNIKNILYQSDRGYVISKLEW